MVANSSSSSDDSNEDEDLNVPRKLNSSSRINASQKIVDSNVDKSDRKKPIVVDVSDQSSILEVSDQLVVDESLEIVEEEVDIERKKTRSSGDSKSVTFLNNADDDDVERDVTSLMKAAGKLQISSPVS